MDRDIKRIVSQMTLEEKAGMCSGEDFWCLKAVERLDIPQVMVSDGPHGLRKQEEEADHLGINESVKSVCFPAACATASSWDVEMLEDMGKTLGGECQAENLSILLGPAANIKRSPLCGRNFEYFSEDPYLTGKMASAQIKGIQSQDVGTSMKHFAVNNQEYNRMSSSSNLSERALREIYLTGFEIAVKEARPKTLMCSYNKINGVYAAENKHLLTEILRNEWGFDGYVMTDWGAVNDRVEGIRAGLDLEMPASGGVNDARIAAAVRDGSLDEALLDQTVENILKVVFSYVDHRHPETVFDREADHKKAVAYAADSAVLLKNSKVLPLNDSQKVVYIGEFAEKPRYQGGGSSHINSSRVTSALESAKEKGRNVTYIKGFPSDRDELDEKELKAAVEAAKTADIAVIFAGLPDVIESEGYDRVNMDLPACQNRVIAEVVKVQPNLVVVLHNGSPVEVPWEKDAAAILEMYLGGQGVGEACDRILYGEVNPSGRLAETFPYRVQDNPSFLNFPGDGKNVNYGEDIFVGYRYYEAKELPVRWAFGHGLSYTSFAYGNLRLSSKNMADHDTVTVSVDVTNTGKVFGKEVVQLYVADKNGTPQRPVKELKGFVKLSLAPGETKTAMMTICARDLSFYHEELHDWYAPSGTYEILVGHASDDIRVSCELKFDTAKILPFEVTGATTIGQLMSDPRTAEKMGEMITKMMQSLGAAAGEQEESGEEGSMGFDPEKMQDMLYGMPIKSLASFGGSDLDVNVLIKTFAQCL